jgi:hypothetical protein
MLHRVILAVIAVAVTSFTCTAALSKPAAQTARWDPSLLLPLPCHAEAKQVKGVWYLNIERNMVTPDGQSPRFATGRFDARVPLWVRFESGQQLVTVIVGADEDGARVDSGTVSTGRMITEKILDVDEPKKCEAFRRNP